MTALSRRSSQASATSAGSHREGGKVVASSSPSSHLEPSSAAVASSSMQQDRQNNGGTGKRSASSSGPNKFLEKLHLPGKANKLRKASLSQAREEEDRHERSATTAEPTNREPSPEKGVEQGRRKSTAAGGAAPNSRVVPQAGEKMTRSSSQKGALESPRRDSPLRTQPPLATTAVVKENARGGSTTNLKTATTADDVDDEDKIIDLSQPRPPGQTASASKQESPARDKNSNTGTSNGGGDHPADSPFESGTDRQAAAAVPTNGAPSKFLSNVLSLLGIVDPAAAVGEQSSDKTSTAETSSSKSSRPSLQAPLIMTEDGPLILETPIEAPPGGGAFGRSPPRRSESFPPRRSSASSGSSAGDYPLTRSSTLDLGTSTLTQTTTGSSASKSSSSNDKVGTSTSTSTLVNHAKKDDPGLGGLQRRPTMQDHETKSCGAENVIPDLTVDQPTPQMSESSAQGNGIPLPGGRSRSGSVLSVMSSKSAGANKAKSGNDDVVGKGGGAALGGGGGGGNLAAMLRDEQNRHRSGSITRSIGGKLAPAKAAGERRASASGSRRPSIKTPFTRNRRGSRAEYTSGEEAAFYSSDEDDNDDGASADDRSDHQVLGFAVASAKRNADFHALFSTVPEDDYLIEDYSCALQKEILIQGRLYVSENHICFYANIFGWVTNLCIPFNDTIRIEKKMTALVIPNGMSFVTKNAKYAFASFLNRDPTYDLITSIWKQNHNIVAIGHSEDQGGELGAKRTSVDIKDRSILDAGESSAAEVIKPESQSRRSTVSTAAENGLPPPSSGVVSTTHAATKCTCLQDGKHYDHVALDATFTAVPEQLFQLIFKSAFFKDFLENNQKLKGDVIEKREYNYIKPLGGSIGPKQTKCLLSDELLHQDPDVFYSILTTTKTPDVPSGNSFSVKTRLCLTWAGAGSCRALVTTAVEWTGKSWVKGIIEKSAIEGQKNYHVDLEKDVRARLKGARPRGNTASEAKETAAEAPAQKVKANGGDAGESKAVKDVTLADQEHAKSSGLFKTVQDNLSAPSLQTILIGLVVLLLLTNLLTLTRRPAKPALAHSRAGTIDSSTYLYVLDRTLASHERIRKEEELLWSWLASEAKQGGKTDSGVAGKIESIMDRLESIERRLTSVHK